MSVLSQIAKLELKAERWPRLLFFLAVILSAGCFGPWMFVHLSHLWRREHYQFFPMLLLAVLVLMRSRWAESRPDGSKRIELKLSTPLLLIAVIAMATALWLNSPWMGYLSSVLMLLLVFRNVPFGRSAVAPLLVLLPLPFALDGELIHGLQRVSSRGASALLDSVGIQHLMSGNVLELPDKTFFVEEACSGIGSVYLLLASAAIFASWKQLRLVVSVPLLGAAIGWAVAGNTFRIFAVAYAHDRHQLDLSEGTRHDLLGSATYLVSLILLLMTEQALLFLMEPVGAPAPSESSGSRLRQLAASVGRLWDCITYADPELRARRYLERGISGFRLSAAQFLGTIAILLLCGCVANAWHFRSDLVQLAAKYKPELVAKFQSSPPVSEMPTELVMQPFKRLEPFVFDRIGGLSVTSLSGNPEKVGSPAIPADVAPALNTVSNTLDQNSIEQSKAWTFQFAESPVQLTITGPIRSDEDRSLVSSEHDAAWTIMETTAVPVEDIANDTPIILDRVFRNGASTFRHEFSAQFTQTGAALPMFAGESLKSVRQQLSDKLRDSSSAQEQWHWRLQLTFESSVPVEGSLRPSRLALFGDILKATLAHWRTPG